MTSQFAIMTPIWNGGQRCVGLAEYRLSGPVTTFEILWRNREDKRIYPHPFTVSTKTVLKCPIQMIKGMRLRIVPLNICKEVTP